MTPPTASLRALDERRDAERVADLHGRRSARRRPARRRRADDDVLDSSGDAISPTPRTIGHAPFASSTLPPTLRLLSRTARDDGAERHAVARAADSGSTSIWYCWMAPPIDATSATPGTALS